MSYAVRNNGLGWRAVASEHDVMDGEFFSTVHPDLMQKITVESVKDKITQKRWDAETGGIVLPNGMIVSTGIADQNRITSVVANAERAGLQQVDFKLNDGWAKITLSELQAIATAVALHVQSCFSAERLHHKTVDSIAKNHERDSQSLIEALEAYDFQSGWPGRK